MEFLFLKSVNINIVLSWIIIAILFVRIILKKKSKQVCFSLWGILCFKFFIPFSFECRWSLIPSIETFSIEDIYNRSFRIHSGISKLDEILNNIIGSRYYEGVTVPTGAMSFTLKILSITWFAGILVFLIGFIIYTIKLKRNLCTAVHFEKNIWESDIITSPFVFGFFKPRIYIPFNLTQIEINNVVAHESSHIKHGDHLWQLLVYLLLMLNWYNPLIWLAYKKFIDDMELACDERVIKKMDISARKNYSKILLNCTVNQTFTLGEQLYFGRENIKERVVNIVKYKKQSKSVFLFSVGLLLIVAICFLTNPENSNGQNILELLKVINN